MPRRRDPKRELAADPVYDSTLVTKFINRLMSTARKPAERIFYGYGHHQGAHRDDPLKLFKKALDNVKPPSR